jgi:ribonuclease J
MSTPSGGLRICPLGGLGEVGMNCLALEQDGWVMLVDCGVTFDRRGLGVDVIHPDFSALEAYRGRIAGVFITHGHEDHIGALPYFLRRFDVPVWAPPYVMGLLRERAAEHEVLSHARILEVRTRRKIEVGPFEVEPIRVTHSIADATALAIETSQGLVIHTGDFKFDETPTDGEAFDVARLSELGDDGVALLCSDSTNIDTLLATGSEQIVAEALLRLVQAAEGRVVVGLFASNVHRLRILGDVAKATGRRLVPLGRSVRTHARVARDTGYLDWPLERLVAPEEAALLPRQQVLGVATGTQAETNAALARLSRGEHAMALEPGDTVIFSSRIIPGHEPEVFALTSELLRMGLKVITRLDEPSAHVSGHAARPEQRRMIELTRPRAFLPLHGTLHHLLRHQSLAESLGIPSTCVLEDGEVAELRDRALTKVGRWPSGRVHVAYGHEIPPEVLRDRRILASAGFAVAVVRVDAEGRILGDIELLSRGVLGDFASPRVLAEAGREARTQVHALSAASRADAAIFSDTVRLAIRRVLTRATGTKPEVLVSVVRAAPR